MMTAITIYTCVLTVLGSMSGWVMDVLYVFIILVDKGILTGDVPLEISVLHFSCL